MEEKALLRRQRAWAVRRHATTSASQHSLLSTRRGPATQTTFIRPKPGQHRCGRRYAPVYGHDSTCACHGPYKARGPRERTASAYRNAESRHEQKGRNAGRFPFLSSCLCRTAAVTRSVAPCELRSDPYLAPNQDTGRCSCCCRQRGRPFRLELDLARSSQAGAHSAGSSELSGRSTDSDLTPTAGIPISSAAERRGRLPRLRRGLDGPAPDRRQPVLDLAP